MRGKNPREFESPTLRDIEDRNFGFESRRGAFATGDQRPVELIGKPLSFTHYGMGRAGLLTALSQVQVLPVEPIPYQSQYQPEGTGCSEIEYRWTNDTGEHQAFYAGSGGFCTSLTLDFSQDTPLHARCITRGPSGEIVPSGLWVDSVLAPNAEEFRRLCPVD